MKSNLIKIILIILLVILISGCRKKNRLPYTPYTPSGPSIGLIQTNLFFSTLTIDPDEDSVALRFYWGYGDTSAWSSWVANEETVSISNSWHLPDTYYVKAQAKDEKEAISAWSLSYPIIITVPETNHPPNVPSILTGPVMGYDDTRYKFLSLAIDPEDNHIAIRFDWNDGDISDWSGWIPSGNSVWMSHRWRYSGTYHVKAQAKDVGELTSEWSEVHQIRIYRRVNLILEQRP